MRLLPPPQINDRNLLGKVANNARLHAAAFIQPLEPLVAARYLLYEAGRGDPWIVPTDIVFEPARSAFHRVYNVPPKALGFIAALRAATAGACPMCGSTGTGSLDHFLPKAEYPEFSFLSLNLVPACFRCNVVRLTKYRGNHPGERPVHPYYDADAAGRIMTVAIDPPFDVPRFRPVPWNVNPQFEATVWWHVENIVAPAGFPNHCAQRWSRLVNDPQLYLGGDANPNAVAAELARQSTRAAHMEQSLNSWDSCFFHGISQTPGAVTYLVAHLAAVLARGDAAAGAIAGMGAVEPADV